MNQIALIPSQTTRIPALSAWVNGFPSITHKLTTGTGDAPLEDGARITDHAVALPDRLELTGWVSRLRSSRGGDARGAWSALRKLHRATEPIEVITPWATYREMLVIDVTAEQVGSEGMRFTLKLDAILRVGTFNPAVVVGVAAMGAAMERMGEVVRGRVYAPSQ